MLEEERNGIASKQIKSNKIADINHDIRIQTEKKVK